MPAYIERKDGKQEIRREWRTPHIIEWSQPNDPMSWDPTGAALSADAVEKMARTLCGADGNDPDSRIILTELPKLSGLASRYCLAPEERYVVPAWHLYFSMACSALAEMNSIKPFNAERR